MFFFPRSSWSKSSSLNFSRREETAEIQTTKNSKWVHFTLLTNIEITHKSGHDYNDFSKVIWLYKYGSSKFRLSFIDRISEIAYSRNAVYARLRKRGHGLWHFHLLRGRMPSADKVFKSLNDRQFDPLDKYPKSSTNWSYTYTLMSVE